MSIDNTAAAVQPQAPISAAPPIRPVAAAPAPRAAAQPVSKAKTKVTTTTDVEIELDYEALLGVLKTAFDIPENAKLHVRVPGGGDWSNTDLTIGDDVPLILTFTKREVRDSNG